MPTPPPEAPVTYRERRNFVVIAWTLVGVMVVFCMLGGGCFAFAQCFSHRPPDDPGPYLKPLLIYGAPVVLICFLGSGILSASEARGLIETFKPSESPTPARKKP